MSVNLLTRLKALISTLSSATTNALPVDVSIPRWVVALALLYGCAELRAYLQYRQALAKAQQPARCPETDESFHDWMSREMEDHFEHEPSSSQHIIESVFSFRHPLPTLRRENVTQGLGNHMFYKSHGEWSSEQHRKVKELVTVLEEKFQKHFGRTFLEGHCEKTSKDLRVMGVLPIQSWYKPLAFYAFMYFIRKILVNRYLHAMGFVRYNYDNGMTFWVRRHPSSTHRPLLFCHGLGVGVAPYLVTVKRMCSDRTLIMAELPNISYNTWVETFPTGQSIVESMVHALGRLEIPSVDILGHSFGTAVMTFFIKRHPEMCNHRVYVDPVCFLQGAARAATLVIDGYFRSSCHNSFLFPFLHPLCFIGNSFKFWFLTRDFYTQVMSNRHCFGSEMWERGDNISEKSLIILAENDDVVPAPMLSRHLRRKFNDKCHVLYHDGAHSSFLHHAALWEGIRQFLDTGKTLDNGANLEHPTMITALNKPLSLTAASAPLISASSSSSSSSSSSAAAAATLV